tara:strand:- start:351 stop:587 length:237 start_codon:yes stop_codon:yes gene_type:complete
MPAKFKPSERAHSRDEYGRMVKQTNGAKRYKHHYLKCQSKETLFNAINSHQTKPKHRQKFIHELIRRGVKIVWRSKDG